MKTKIKNICKEIAEDYEIYIYCEQKIISKWIYIAIKDKKTNLYYAGYNTEKEFRKRDMLYMEPTRMHSRARNYICKAINLDEID